MPCTLHQYTGTKCHAQVYCCNKMSCTTIRQHAMHRYTAAITSHAPECCCNNMPCTSVYCCNNMSCTSSTAATRCRAPVYCCNKIACTNQYTGHDLYTGQAVPSCLSLALARISSISLLASALSSYDRDPYFFPDCFSHWNRQRNTPEANINNNKTRQRRRQRVTGRRLLGIAVKSK